MCESADLIPVTGVFRVCSDAAECFNIHACFFYIFFYKLSDLRAFWPLMSLTFLITSSALLNNNHDSVGIVILYASDVLHGVIAN